jgi:hypothetical protein
MNQIFDPLIVVTIVGWSFRLQMVLTIDDFSKSEKKIYVTKSIVKICLFNKKETKKVKIFYNLIFVVELQFDSYWHALIFNRFDKIVILIVFTVIKQTCELYKLLTYSLLVLSV